MTPEEREFVESIKLRIVDELADDESGNSERGWMLIAMSKLVRIVERLEICSEAIAPKESK